MTSARPMSVPSRVLILGTGALASFVGARLARGGRGPVTLAGTWTAALEAIAARGIVVEGDGPEWSASVDTRSLGGALPPADLVLVLVKSYRTAAVAPHAARALAPGGLVLTLQNGLGNRETLAEKVGADRVALGVTSLGATLLAPGRVRFGGPGETVLAGAVGTESAVQGVADLLAAAGIPTAVRSDVEALLWGKLVVSCAINPLSACLDVPNGALLGRPDPRARMAAAAREVAAVARARGIALAGDPVAMAEEVARRTAGNVSSMLQDVRRGAPTEIDAICGAVAAEGRRLGVPTPVIEGLWRSVSSLDAAARRTAA